MNLRSRALSRRTFLRGAGVTLALPFLDAMRPAFALTQADRAVSKGIQRLAFIYIPNGVNMAAWSPVGKGNTFELGRSMPFLQPFKDQLTVFSGLSHHQADRMNDGAGDHSRAVAVFLSGAHAIRTQGADLKVGTTADQIAAKTLGRETLLPSLQLSMDQPSIGVCDEGYTCAYMNTMSWSTPNTPLPMERNPRLVFERLFGEGATAAQRLRRARQDASILDGALKELGILRRRLGPSDQQRIDQYTDAIREVELRVHRLEKKNAEAAGDEDLATIPDGIPETFEDHIKLMYDLQVLAFQADLTRVVTFMVGREVGGRSYPQVGVPEGHHSLSHHDNDAEKLDKLAKIDAYHVQLLAYFLERLRATSDGDTSLLDQSAVLYGGGISNGNLHSHDHLPVFVAGRLGGTIRGGQHLFFDEEVPMSNLLVSLLDKANVGTEQLGDSTGRLSGF